MSLNKVMLIGNAGKEADIRYVAPDQPVATLSLATTNPGYTHKDGTRVEPTTEWHRVVLWRQLALTVERFVRKGDKLFVEGSLHTRTYTDRDGAQHTVTEVWAERLEIFDYHNIPPLSANADEDMPSAS